MQVEQLINDIPESIARAAHQATSFVPEKRAVQEREDYARTLAADYEQLAKYADTDAKKSDLAAEFERYREGYKAKVIAYLNSRSRCMSSMITGPANFPTRRNQKRNDVAHRRLEELIDFRKRALSAIEKVLRPELRPIMAGDSDAVERLQADIAEAEKLQALMKSANAAIRKHKKAGAEAQHAALVELGLSAEVATNLLNPTPPYPLGFVDFELTNNNANIKRMKDRLARISKAKALPEVKRENAETGITLEDSPADNRIRLFFPGKPDEAVRSQLKSNGFRWTPFSRMLASIQKQQIFAAGRKDSSRSVIDERV